MASIINDNSFFKELIYKSKEEIYLINNEGIIQFRPSGVRVKKPDFFPALVAIVHTPIVGKYLRKLTPKECSRLQSFPEEFKIISQDNQAYKQFGNSLNVKVAKYVFENTILKEINKNQESSK